MFFRSKFLLSQKFFRSGFRVQGSGFRRTVFNAHVSQVVRICTAQSGALFRACSAISSCKTFHTVWPSESVFRNQLILELKSVSLALASRRECAVSPIFLAFLWSISDLFWFQLCKGHTVILHIEEVPEDLQLQAELYEIILFMLASLNKLVPFQFAIPCCPALPRSFFVAFSTGAYLVARVEKV